MFLRRGVLATLIATIVVLLSGCTEKNYYLMEPEQDTDTYTIMLYGCGGGNLDPSMQVNLQEAIAEGVNERVQFTGQIKYSKEYQAEHPELRGTLRFSLRDAEDEKVVPAEVLSETLPLYDPETLADYIRWSKQTAPADQYILVLWNHGNGWTPYQDGEKSRAVCFDDNLEGMPPLSLDELVEAVKLSETHLKMIYYDACQMALLENYAGLTEVTDYVLGASHNTPGIGGDYSSLIYNLTQSVNFEEAMAIYCNDVIRHWEASNEAYDLGLFDLSHMDDVLDGVSLLGKTLDDILQIAPGSENYDPYTMAAIDFSIYKCYRFSTSTPYYDVGNLAELLAYRVANESHTPRFIRAASTLSRALSRAFVCHYYTSQLNSRHLTIGVTMLHKKDWAEQGYEGVYEQLTFDRKTKWSNWLKRNEMVPRLTVN